MSYELFEVEPEGDGDSFARFNNIEESIELLHVSGPVRSWVYCIPARGIITRRGLIRWIRHICEKNWITNMHIIQLIDLSSALVRGKVFPTDPGKTST